MRVAGRLLKKGRVLTTDDVTAIRAEGIADVVVARFEPDDIAEDEAAARIAAQCADGPIRVGAAFTGRANIYAEQPGVAVIDTALVDNINALHEAITVATVPAFARVGTHQMLATIKIIPFAAPRAAVEAAERLLNEGPLLRVAQFRPLKVALISTMLPGTKPTVLDKGEASIADRLSGIGSALTARSRVAHAVGPLTEAISEVQNADLILVLGASAITDRRDVIPAAIEAAGGQVTHFGMPVDPGNLLLVGDVGGVPVIGLPGCARSPKLNGFDFVLWRLAAGLPVGRSEIAAMGVGGLLTEIPTRPQPRDEPPATAPRAPKVAAMILAAGLSSRMGRNKLLERYQGKPLVRHVADAAAASPLSPLIVVTGNESAAVREAFAGLTISTVENLDYSKGLSTSLKQGLSTLPEDCDAALVLLGDMPLVSPALIGRLIAAFDPAEDRAIIVPTRNGKRGNPVLWARRFFPEMLTIEGDTGAKHLMGAYPELVCEVEAPDDGPLTDVDTPEALAALTGEPA
ncbi:MAG TPA: molybdopterin-binding/glycosyltransferase family 2 protein [Rhizomicrobium sp.]|nr:molybdopterin-binding/glycosyltransferase family 2 protein [Rhizomicrobium sp.]